jgi:pantetheine-phosphate adenylyltransferase
VYDPFRDDNEEKSAEAWLAYSHPDCNSCYTEDNCGDEMDFDREYVAEIILSTKEPFKEYDDKNERLINEADFNIFTKSNKDLIEYENNIFYEYQKFPIEEYRVGRIEFLQKIQKSFRYRDLGLEGREYKACDFLINYVKNKQYKIGIYPGSFNPFHIGHLDMINQAEKVFDKVIIAQGYNRDKEKPVLIHDAIQETIVYKGLLSDVFEGNENYTLIRGLRNSDDLNDEIALKQTLIDLGLTNPIVYFTCRPENQHISSSMIRSLYEFGEDTYERYLV